MKDKIITVDNIIGRTDNVTDHLKDPDSDYTGEITLDKHDDRFMCGCCKRNVNASKYNDSMYIDSDRKVYCRSCWCKHLDTTMRSVRKNPNEDRPRHILEGGHYYRLIKQ